MSFLRNRKQKVVLDGQDFLWADVNAQIPQGYILGPVFFLIYINDLTNGLSSNAELFVDATSLFSVVHNVSIQTDELNNDFVKID